MTKTSSYAALLFRQRSDSPLQVAFVAPSAEIDTWARVPTKRTGNIRNFQRAQIDQHVREVSRFFGDKSNASPTAIVVGFDPVRARDRIRLLDQNGSPVDGHAISAGTPAIGRVEIDSPSMSYADSNIEYIARITEAREQLVEYMWEELRELTQLDQPVLKLLLDEFDQRAQQHKPTLSEATESATDDDDVSDLESGDEVFEDDDSIPIDELGEPARLALSALTPSERQIVIGRLEFVAGLQAALLAHLPPDGLRKLYVEATDELKPALLIDGQHRVAGTRDLPNVPFLVCALPDAQWPELAFQFIVTNRTARRVPESLLINIVGNSLSKVQRASIEGRLREAGIRVGLIEAIMKVNEDEQSPFFNMLAFGIKGENGFLDAAAMRNKVVKLWYDRKSPVRELFDHFNEGKLARERTDYWKAEDKWFEFFIAFWSAVRERYQGSEVFSADLRPDKTPVSKLMSATVLKIFQETILLDVHSYALDRATKEDVPLLKTIADADAFASLVQNTLKPLTPEFFQGWKITGFDGSKGAKEDLSEAIRMVIKGTKVSSLKDPKKPHRLFKEST